MKPAVFFHNFFGHLNTINHHKFQVMKNCFRVGLYKQGLLHDMSKYSFTEFIPGVKYYQDGNRSPNNAQREAEGCSTAKQEDFHCLIHRLRCFQCRAVAGCRTKATIWTQEDRRVPRLRHCLMLSLQEKMISIL